jgi:hypothetical protein
MASATYFVVPKNIIVSKLDPFILQHAHNSPAKPTPTPAQWQSPKVQHAVQTTNRPDPSLVVSSLPPKLGAPPELTAALLGYLS